MIEFRDVSKVYENGTHALNHVNIKINKGEFVFVVGASGAGKSTFLKLMMREEVPSHGKIIIKNQDLSSLTRSEIPYFRRGLGIVFQDFRLIPKMTVFDNVAFAMRVIGAPEREIKKRVPSAVLIFITAPSFEEIRSRLVHRGDVAPEIMAERLEHAKWEYAQAYQYDYTVMNDTVDHAVARIGEIMTAAKQEKMDPVHG